MDNSFSSFTSGVTNLNSKSKKHISKIKTKKGKIKSIRLQRQKKRSRNFQINDFNVSDTVPSIENVNIISCQLKARENVSYVLVNNVELGYNFETNLCLKVKMINFTSNLQMQIDGYRCIQNETVSVYTCFGYHSSIKFIPIVNCDTELNSNENIQHTMNELAEQYQDFISYEERLINGSAVLLRIEIDNIAMIKFKLVLHYIMKSIPDRKKANKMLSDSNQKFSQLIKDGSNYSALSAKMDQIYDSVGIGYGDVVLVCGSSNCGKSFLIHHLINRYISKKSNQNIKSPVYYLECDPGQTEFAPCGILSLVRLHENMIQTVPGFKFMSKQNSSCLTESNKIISKIFGTTTPSFYVKTYISLVEQLLDHYLSLNTTSPLFINTMGWIENAGLDILLEIIQLARPNLVIRIHNNDDDFSPPISPVQELKDRSIRKYLSAFNDIDCINNLRIKLKFKLFYASSCSFNQYSHFKSSSLRREINQLAYLTCGLFPAITYLPFYALKPIKFSLSNLYVHIMSCPQIASHLIYDLLNVSWVILGNIQDCNGLDSVAVEKSDQSSVKMLSHLPKSAVCLGCGIVRNIDPSDNCIYITMPDTFSRSTNQINLIVLPNLISIPTGLLNEQFLYLHSSKLPYLLSH